MSGDDNGAWIRVEATREAPTNADEDLADLLSTFSHLPHLVDVGETKSARL